MGGYSQFCPVAKAAEVLCQRWTPLIVRELLLGSYGRIEFLGPPGLIRRIPDWLGRHSALAQVKSARPATAIAG